MCGSRILSDHCFIMMKETDPDFGPKPFRVLDVWLKEVDVSKVVKSAWSIPVSSCRPDCVFRDRLKMVLKKWSQDRFDNLNEEVEKASEEALRWERFAKERSLSGEEINQWMEARKVWLKKDSIYTGILRQRARVKWHAEGDENSKLFHTMVRRRNRKTGLWVLWWMVNGTRSLV